MPRCALLAATVLVAAMSLSAAPTWAQAPRNFPVTALRGELVVTAPPEVLLNKQPTRLAPGSRLRDQNNMLVLSGAALNQRLVVQYTLDLQGHVLDVWVLTPAEAARRPWPTTPAEAAAWSFNTDTQTWSKP